MRYDGQGRNFQSLRHANGAWCALAGEHLLVVEQTMRHSPVSLRMDTDGHLFPGEAADAVRRLTSFTGPASEQLAATGRDNSTRESRSDSRSAHGAKRNTVRAKACNNPDELKMQMRGITQGAMPTRPSS